MEEIKILQFIGGIDDCKGYGSGDGSGAGYCLGDGDGTAYGTGYGYGSGDGSGDGDGTGDGSGYGYGLGDGSCYCDGLGDGSGYGSGYGTDDGTGYGTGDGIKIKKIGGDLVFYIDQTPIIFDKICGNFAKGRIIREEDFFIYPCCYIARSGCHYFYGETPLEVIENLKNNFNRLN